MRSLKKETNAITLVALVITVVIMIIIVSITTYTGIDTYKSVKVNQFVERMKLIQSKVDEYSAEELKVLGSELTTAQQLILEKAYNNGEGISTKDALEYRYFTSDDLLNVFDIENIDDEVIVNFNTREVISLTGIEYEKKIYYTQYKLPNGQMIVENITSTRNLDYNLSTTMDGLNAKVTITNLSISNGTLSYQKAGDNYWTTITNYTEKEKNNNINLIETGTYKFKLIDNVTNEKLEKELNVILTNKPKTDKVLSYDYSKNSENWAYAQSAGLWYVWIPRFASNINNDIKFIKGNSNIATDNTYIDNTYNIHSKFGANLTGLWVNVNNEGQAGLNMIDLLNSNASTLTEL